MSPAYVRSQELIYDYLIMDGIEKISSDLYASKKFCEAEAIWDQWIKKNQGCGDGNLGKAFNNRGHAKYMQVLSSTYLRILHAVRVTTDMMYYYICTYYIASKV